MWGCVRVQFSCWQPVNNHPVKLTVNTHAFETSLTSQATSVRAKKKKKHTNSNEKLLKCLMIEKQCEFVWCWGMWRWSLDLDRCTSRTETPVLEAETPQSKMSFFFFSFSLLPLEVTFTLAANETKQRRVIKADVFIQGFYRKLISWGMQSCARLIGGKLTFLKGKQAASVKSYRICIYIHGLRCVRHKSFNSNSSHHRFFFFLFKHWKKWGCGLTQWTTRWVNEPSQAICPAVTVTLTLKKTTLTDWSF